MEVEVKLPSGGYCKSSVQLVASDGLSVSFENDWQSTKKVPYESCRLPPIASGSSRPSSPSCMYKDGDTVEALAKFGDHEGSAWHEAKVKQVKGEFAIVEFPTFDGGGVGSSTDVLTFDKIRLSNDRPPLTPDSFKHQTIEVPEALREFSKRPDIYTDFAKTIGNILVNFEESSGKLCVISCYDVSIKRALMLSEMYFRDTIQKMTLLSRTEESAKQLQKLASSKMASSHEKKNKEIRAVECPICSEIYREPKFLTTCGHTFCDQCIKEIPGYGCQVRCPLCRKVTVIPPNGLPANFALADVVEPLRKEYDLRKETTKSVKEFHDNVSSLCQRLNYKLQKWHAISELMNGIAAKSFEMVDTTETMDIDSCTQTLKDIEKMTEIIKDIATDFNHLSVTRHMAIIQANNDNIFVMHANSNCSTRSKPSVTNRMFTHK